MRRDLHSSDEIIRATRRLLRAAEVGERLPTPVEDLIGAAKLSRGEDDLFDDLMIDEAPAHLRAAIRKIRGRVHAVLDRKQRKVYVRPDISNDGRRRFRALHEVGHEILPSQNDPAYADDDFTLSPAVRALWEQDANQAGSELMFQGDRFSQMAAEYEVGLAAVVELSQLFGSSIQAALRRYAEFHRIPVAAVVLDMSPVSGEELAYRRYEAVCSEAWESRFDRPDRWPKLLSPPVFDFVTEARRAPVGGVVEWDGMWPSRENVLTDVRAEITSTSYRRLVLLWQPKRQVLKRRRALVLPDAA